MIPWELKSSIKKKIDTLIKVNTKGKCRSVLSVYIPLLPSSVIPIMATERFREVGLYLWRIENKIKLLTKCKATLLFGGEEEGWEGVKGDLCIQSDELAFRTRVVKG